MPANTATSATRYFIPLPLSFVSQVVDTVGTTRSSFRTGAISRTESQSESHPACCAPQSHRGRTQHHARTSCADSLLPGSGSWWTLAQRIARPRPLDFCPLLMGLWKNGDDRRIDAEAPAPRCNERFCCKWGRRFRLRIRDLAAAKPDSPKKRCRMRKLSTSARFSRLRPKAGYNVG